MKKVVLTVASAVALSGLMTAQTPWAIPNAGFESWVTSGSQNGKANNWAGYGDIGLLIGAPTYTMITTYFKDGAKKNSGSFSMRIENMDYSMYMIGNLEGLAWLGTAGTSTANAGIYGIPFSQNIHSFSAFLSYSINAPATSGIDTAVVFCQTTKWTGSTEILIEDATVFTDTDVPTFQPFNQTAVSINTGIPDTLWIVAISSFNAADANADNRSKLWIDDLALTTVSGITGPVLDFVDTRMAPNPANDVVRFTTSAKNIGGYLKLYDALGKVVLTVPVTNALDNRFSVETLPSGLYFYQVENASGEVNAHGKLVVTK
jgi:hypothetical protein